uniref:Putative biotinidase and vanin n=1 Tax=Ixodes ricinus TaxID=34613 RepID=V5I2E9_IXORI
MQRVFLSQLVICILASGAWAFRAAVFEHVQLGSPATEARSEVVAKNLAAYKEAAKQAAAEKADMIVFPEDGIMFGFSKRADVDATAEDVPEKGGVPCVDKKDHLPVLANLSCMAKENQMYVVANLVDKKPCTRQPCPEKTIFYNTNVAFDRNGTLVSRYHKNHLFVEPFMSSPDPPEFAVFETDFGVRAGMFICFDVLYPGGLRAGDAPQRDPGHREHLVVRTSCPACYAVAEQQAWSLRHGVPLLAANIQKKTTGSLGSGIYAGIRGPLNYTYSPDGKAKLLVASLDDTPVNPRYHGDEIAPP